MRFRQNICTAEMKAPFHPLQIFRERKRLSGIKIEVLRAGIKLSLLREEMLSSFFMAAVTSNKIDFVYRYDIC
jgi:hypothetical protein